MIIFERRKIGRRSC